MYSIRHLPLVICNNVSTVTRNTASTKDHRSMAHRMQNREKTLAFRTDYSPAFSSLTASISQAVQAAPEHLEETCVIHLSDTTNR